MEEEKGRLNQITRRLLEAAIEGHRRVGLGLLESAYESCLGFELRWRGLRIEPLRPLPVAYKDMKLDCGYGLERGVEDANSLEVEAIGHLAPIHHAQLFSYPRISAMKVSWLIKNGHKRIVNEFPDSAFAASSAVKPQV